MFLLFLALFLGALSAGFFALFRRLRLRGAKEPPAPPSAISRYWMRLRAWRDGRVRSPVPPPPVPEKWDIYSKRGSLKAVRAAGPHRPFFGLLYAFFFHWWIPVGIWRYGWGNTLTYLLVPILLGALLAIVAGALMGLKDESRMGIGLLISAPLRGYIGVQISFEDAKMRAETLLRRGWGREGQRTAESARKAKAMWRESAGEAKSSASQASGGKRYVTTSSNG
jgi:hypothetical protein